jgi:hypothetical protein
MTCDFNSPATVNCHNCSAKTEDGPTKIVGYEFIPVGEQREVCDLNHHIGADEQVGLWACEKFRASKDALCPHCAYEGHEVKIMTNVVDDTPLEAICPACGSGWESWPEYAQECIGTMQNALSDYRHMERRHELALECLRARDKQDMRKEAA